MLCLEAFLLTKCFYIFKEAFIYPTTAAKGFLKKAEHSLDHADPGGGKKRKRL
ncbi:UNVERIFIED_CONTAM: hypothetical protein ABID98_000422 [Brevibacillus sp. OAP136]